MHMTVIPTPIANRSAIEIPFAAIRVEHIDGLPRSKIDSKLPIKAYMRIHFQATRSGGIQNEGT